MPPLECANFLECENKTVCVAPFGSLRPSFWIQPQCFSIIYQKIITIHPAEFFFFFFAKMAWNAIVCETTDVSRETSIFPIFQKTWFQAILAKKKTEKKKKNTEYNDFMECEDLAERVNLQYVYVPSCGVRRNYGMRRILSMRGWYRDHGGKFRGQDQNSNPKASPNFQGHTS